MENQSIPFTPLRDFHSPEFRSDYLVGLSYQARPADIKLQQLLPKWIEEGKVRLGFPEGRGTNDAKVEGRGEVRDGEVQTIGVGDVGVLKL